MNIVMVTLGAGGSYEASPRGTYAIVHFLQQRGHRVLYLDRPVALRPWRLLRRIRAWNPDVVLTQQQAAAELGGLRKLGLLGCPVVHAWDDYYAEQSRFPRWFMWPIEVASVRWADHVTTVSRFNEHLARAWGVPCTYIPHGTEARQTETALVLESNRMKLVYLGDQDPYKGTGLLVEAVRGLDCDLFMVGKPNDRLQAVSPGNVHFVGTVPAGEVQAVLAQADVLVNSSDQDSNFKIFEYIKAGKPVLGLKGKAEWAFTNGEDALLVDDLRAGILRLMKDAALREGLAAGIRRREVLTWEQHVQRIEDVLRRVVESHAAGSGRGSNQ